MTSSANSIPNASPDKQLSHEEVAQFIHAEQQNRRGGFIPRPVFVQKLNEFGSPSLAVLTFEQASELTIAGLIQVAPEDHLIIYDDNAPNGAQYFHGIVSIIRGALRPQDAAIGMQLIYIDKVEPTNA